MPVFASAPSEAERIARLAPPARKPVRMVLDTDTYNEIDDQFAVTYSLLSPESVCVEALYAAPFFNERSTGPGDGMEKSYEEILRLLDRLGVSPEGFVFKGSRGYLPAADRPVESAAAADLVAKAMTASAEAPLYVVAIGAITNVASALLLEPGIAGRIVVVWLGGHAFHWPNTREFNLRQDIPAARVIFDCGVPVVLVPCMGVTSHLLTTESEIDRFVRGRGAIGDYLAGIYSDHFSDHFGRAKVLWDLAAVAWLVNSDFLNTELVHSPVLSDEAMFSADGSRHLIRSAYYVNRDRILGDLFRKLEARAAGQ